MKRIFREPIPKQCLMDHKCDDLCNISPLPPHCHVIEGLSHIENPYPLGSRLHNDLALILTLLNLEWPNESQLVSSSPLDHSHWQQLFGSESKSNALVWLNDLNPEIFPIETLEISGTFVRKGYWSHGIKAFESIHWLATCHSGYTIYCGYKGEGFQRYLFESSVCTLQAFQKFQYVAQCVCKEWKPGSLDKVSDRMKALQWLNQNVKK